MLVDDKGSAETPAGAAGLGQSTVVSSAKLDIWLSPQSFSADIL
jgi:hypothetical protein